MILREDGVHIIRLRRGNKVCITLDRLHRWLLCPGASNFAVCRMDVFSKKNPRSLVMIGD